MSDGKKSYMSFPKELTDEEKSLQEHFKQLRLIKEACEEVKKQKLVKKPEAAASVSSKSLQDMISDAAEARKKAEAMIKTGAIPKVPKVQRPEDQKKFKRSTGLRRLPAALQAKAEVDEEESWDDQPSPSRAAVQSYSVKNEKGGAASKMAGEPLIGTGAIPKKKPLHRSWDLPATFQREIMSYADYDSEFSSSASGQSAGAQYQADVPAGKKVKKNRGGHEDDAGEPLSLGGAASEMSGEPLIGTGAIPKRMPSPIFWTLSTPSRQISYEDYVSKKRTLKKRDGPDDAGEPLFGKGNPYDFKYDNENATKKDKREDDDDNYLNF